MRYDKKSITREDKKMHFNREFLRKILEKCHSGQSCLEEIRPDNKKMRDASRKGTNAICIEAPVSVKNEGYDIDAYKVEDCIDASKSRNTGSYKPKRADCIFLIKKSSVSDDNIKSSTINSVALLIEIKTGIGKYQVRKKMYSGVYQGNKQLESTSLWIERKENNKEGGRKDTLVYPIIVLMRADVRILDPRKKIKPPPIDIRGVECDVELVLHSRTKKADFWKKKFS